MAALAEFLSIDPPAAGLQRLRAGLSGHAYDRHRHETYAVGVTEAGLQCFHYRGAAWASTTGRVIVLYPDEVHDGHAGAPTGFVYSMLYVDPSAGYISATSDSTPSIAKGSRSIHLGHEDAFPRQRLSARSRFSQRTFGGRHGNGRSAPIPALAAL